MERTRQRRDEVVQQVGALFALGAFDGLNDGRLLERFTTVADESAGAAFSALVERHGPMVLRVCRSILRNRDDAEDAFQATFLVLVRRSRSLWVRDSLGPWLYQVAHRTATRARAVEDRRRRRERRAASGLVAEVEERPPDDLAETLHEEIARLPERYRAAVVLCLLEGLPNDQAARRLGWPVGTVQSRLARGRERLKQSLTRRGLSPSIAAPAAAAVPPRLAEAAVQSALRYAAGGSQAAAVSSSILVLTEGVLRMMTLAKLKTTLLAVATVAGLGLATTAVPRSIGADGREPAIGQKPQAVTVENRPKPPTSEGLVAGDPGESTVWIRAKREGAVAYGRGTVIKSTPDEAIILTSGHYFATAELFAVDSTKLTVTYRGKEKALTGIGRSAGLTATTRQIEEADAEFIDCDANHHVALLRIRPGRVLPASPIVSTTWKPRPGMTVTTIRDGVGDLTGNLGECSVLNVLQGVEGDPDYEAITCDQTPPPGGSGGGLFVREPAGNANLLAGVCNFSTREDGMPRGLYASPKMIYALLDKNGLSSLYQAAASSEASPPAQAPPGAIPYPIESTVLIRTSDEGKEIASASGTIIKSTPRETVILTCASIAPPEATGNAGESVKLTVAYRVPTSTSSEYEIGQTPAELIDRDAMQNLALVRLRPGRVLPASPIVPRNWEPKPGKRMVAAQGIVRGLFGEPVDCSILRLSKGRDDNPAYEAIVCDVDSSRALGCGLFTKGPYRDGNLLAGVCNTTASNEKTTTYASPKTIHVFLDKNGLSSLYEADLPSLNSSPEKGAPDSVDKRPESSPAKSEIASNVDSSGVARSPSPFLTSVMIRVGTDEPITAAGTVVKSTKDESIILTCARIFESKKGPEVPPSKFAKAITVLHEVVLDRAPGAPGPVPTAVFRSPGEVIDYDFRRDVALVRIRPGREIPASPIVTKSWKPEAKERVLRVTGFGEPHTVCIEECSILGSYMSMEGDFAYQGIQCLPRSRNVILGGGLFARNQEGAMLVGTCRVDVVGGPPNFGVELHNFYSSPAMIYPILDRNGLSSLYQADASSKALPPAQASPTVPKPAESPAAKDAPKSGGVLEPAVPKTPIRPIPLPNMSTVQIRVKGEKPVDASGTIIKSTPDEAIILTCSAIFPKELVEIPVSFWAADEPSGNREKYSFIRTPGELIDVDPLRGVALVRIRPGRLLESSPIVPRNWKPGVGKSMTVIKGYAEGRIGILGQCRIVGFINGIGDKGGYEAVECDLLPRQSCSGSGLFTTGPYGEGNLLAGVCNFSDAQRNSGLYATPAMIYPILDKNGLSSLYQDEDPSLNNAPPAAFRFERIGPNAGKPASAGQGPSTSRDDAPQGDRLRAVERRVDAIDEKLDEILNLLKKPR